MGVDVSLFTVGPKVSDQKLVAANEAFQCRTGEDEWNQLIRVAVSDVGVGVAWKTLSRYYGPGYERGDWPRIHAAIVLLRFLFPDHRVFYGGDNTEPYCPEVTDDLLAEYWSHWLGPHGQAYLDRIAGWNEARANKKDTK